MNRTQIQQYVYKSFTGQDTITELNQDYEKLVDLLNLIYQNDSIVSDINLSRSLDTATGDSLDIIGMRLGIDRNKYCRHMVYDSNVVIVSIDTSLYSDVSNLFIDDTKPIVIPPQSIIEIKDSYNNTYSLLLPIIISNITYNGSAYISMINDYDNTIPPNSIVSLSVDPRLVSNINLSNYYDYTFIINNNFAISKPSATMNDNEYRYAINTKIQSILTKSTDFILGELNRILNVVYVHKFEHLYGYGSTVYYIETTNIKYDNTIKNIAEAILDKYSYGNTYIRMPNYVELTIYTSETNTDNIKYKIENTRMGEVVDLSEYNISSILINNIPYLNVKQLTPNWNEKYIVTEFINV